MVLAIAVASTAPPSDWPERRNEQLGSNLCDTNRRGLVDTALSPLIMCLVWRQWGLLSNMGSGYQT